MTSMAQKWLELVQSNLFPPTCLLCNNPGKLAFDLCTPCYQDLAINLYCCYRCAENYDQAKKNHQLCGHCLKHIPAYTKTYAPFLYQGSIRYLLHHLKFNAQYKNARLLGMLMAEFLMQNADIPERIIPVPLHPLRYRQRGFNQSIEIAKTLQTTLGIPLDFKSCIRHRNTPHQIDLSAKLRKTNLKNAFSVTSTITAQHVAIIDDVMTTGTTVNELAKVLLKTGVKRVDVWVCARA